MPDAWTAQASAAIEQFDTQSDARPLLSALQRFRMESTQKPSAQRRSILDAGRPMAARAAEAVDNVEIAGDVAGLMVESGLYLLECARPTVAETNVPRQILPDHMQDPNARLGPSMFTREVSDGLMLMTRGYAHAHRSNPNNPQLDALRDYIIDSAKGLLVGKGEIETDRDRLVLLCTITRSLGDDLLFTQAMCKLSALMRDAQQPAAAEAVLRQGLDWELLQPAPRNTLLRELAAALSEQGKFADAEAIQREILGD